MNIILWFYGSFLFAGEAMVTVLEAPLFKQESQESPILQYLRKGEVIYIDERELKEESSKKIFYKTLDKNGRDVFVLGEHIKIIYKDSRELTDKFPPEDNTDYRITEPIPEKFPFLKINRPLLTLLLGIGPQRKLSYPYSESIIYEQYQIRTSLGVNYFWPKLESQPFRWGINGAFYNGNRRFMLENGTKSFEQEGIFSAGPQLWFDALRGEEFEINYIVGLNLLYDRTLITQELSSGSSGERAFQGLDLIPQAAVYFSALEILWGLDLQFIIEAQIIPPYTLRPTNANPDNGSWNSTNQDIIAIPFGGQINFYLGISTKL